ncbi:MAG: lytic transglycosylase domain-containing protein [Christensenella sp.]
MSRVVNGKRRGNSKKAIIFVCVAAVIAAAIIIGAFVVLPALERQQYNLEYKDLIEQYSAKYNIDPYFTAAVIHTESGFDAEAVSEAGAIGLMQIMPETGEWIAGKLGNAEFKTQDLHDPSTNIEMGCWYLQFLSERFDNNLPVMMAAYNAGHNKVREWLEDAKYSQDGKTLTEIPYEQTENYVKKVTKAYEKYKEFYELG